MLSEAAFEHITALYYYPATGELKMIPVNAHYMITLQTEIPHEVDNASERGSYYAPRSSPEGKRISTARTCNLQYFDSIE